MRTLSVFAGSKKVIITGADGPSATVPCVMAAGNAELITCEITIHRSIVHLRFASLCWPLFTWRGTHFSKREFKWV